MTKIEKAFKVFFKILAVIGIISSVVVSIFMIPFGIMVAIATEEEGLFSISGLGIHNLKEMIMDTKEYIKDKIKQSKERVEVDNNEENN